MRACVSQVRRRKKRVEEGGASEQGKFIQQTQRRRNAGACGESQKENGVRCQCKVVGLNGQYHNQECQVGSEDKKENEKKRKREKKKQGKEKTIGKENAVRTKAGGGRGGENGKG